jgi:hypothetical protein
LAIRFRGGPGKATTIELSAVQPAPPKVSGVKLTVQGDPNSLSYKVKLAGQYSGGTEGASEITWYKQKAIPSSKREQISASTTRFTDFEAEPTDTYITAVYKPIRDDGEEGKPVESQPVRIPGSGIITTADARVVLNSNFTEVCCILRPNAAGLVGYSWAHRVNGQLIRLPGKNTVHKITADDLDKDLCCILDRMGEIGEHKTAIPIEIKPPLAEQLRPKIKSAIIMPVNRELYANEPLDRQFVAGRQQEVVLEYEGPQKTAVVKWLRQTDDGWQQIFEGDKYTLTRADRTIRAVVTVTPRARFLKNFTADVETPQVLVRDDLEDDPVLARLARAIKRSGKGEFQASLLTGETAQLIIEGQEGGGQLSIKNGRTVMHVSSIQDVAFEPYEPESNSLTVTGSHHYRTEVAFLARQTSTKQELTPLQARNLFVITVRAFQSRGPPR